MPRRISDYPDAFAGWNLISSFGSIISVVATWLFLYIVYVQLVEGKATSRYPWLTPQFYSDSLQTLLNRSYNSLEWALNSPPKPHAFVSLPLQSFFVSLVLRATGSELSRRSTELQQTMARLDSRNSHLFTREEEIKARGDYQSEGRKRQAILDNECAIERYCNIRATLQDRIWAANYRREQLYKSGLIDDRRPADSFDENIDQTVTSSPDED